LVKPQFVEMNKQALHQGITGNSKVPGT
jgi:hypothetical protein